MMICGCMCVSTDFAVGQAGPDRVVLGTGTNVLGTYEVTARRDCPQCGGVGDPEIPAGPCVDCGETDRLVLDRSFWHGHVVLCGNCILRRHRGAPLTLGVGSR
jgi:hypothetical protein